MSKETFESKIAEFIALCYKLADFIDMKGDDGDNFTLDAIGLGYCAASDRIRRGIVAVTELEMEYRHTKQRAKYANMRREGYREFMVDMFGEDSPDEYNDEIKARIRKFMDDLRAELDEKHKEDDE